MGNLGTVEGRRRGGEWGEESSKRVGNIGGVKFFSEKRRPEQERMKCKTLVERILHSLWLIWRTFDL